MRSEMEWPPPSAWMAWTLALSSTPMVTRSGCSEASAAMASLNTLASLGLTPRSTIARSATFRAMSGWPASTSARAKVSARWARATILLARAMALRRSAPKGSDGGGTASTGWGLSACAARPAWCGLPSSGMTMASATVPMATPPSTVNSQDSHTGVCVGGAAGLAGIFAGASGAWGGAGSRCHSPVVIFWTTSCVWRSRRSRTRG